jgi:hypothetical protein
MIVIVCTPSTALALSLSLSLHRIIMSRSSLCFALLYSAVLTAKPFDNVPLAAVRIHLLTFTCFPPSSFRNFKANEELDSKPTQVYSFNEKAEHLPFYRKRATASTLCPTEVVSGVRGFAHIAHVHVSSGEDHRITEIVDVCII